MALRNGSSRRGSSLDNGLLLKAKDADLVLFNEMQKHQKAKRRCDSDFKLQIGFTAQGESSDLLNVDDDKNDYDWLLTPPDTPLFPSLDDDDEPHPVNTPRGRARNVAITVSRQLMNEKIQRRTRSSASTHRPSSPSPHSSNGAVVHPATARPCSPPRSTTTPLFAPTKPSTPTPRPSTPTFPRTSAAAGGQAFSSSSSSSSSYSRRRTSPAKPNCGQSASPKLRRSQSNPPGLSMNAPSNTQTSLSDQSGTRNSMDSSSNLRRQSISSSASTCSSSSHSHAKHQFAASCSKASAASPGDDDVSGPISTVRKQGAFANGRAVASKKMTSRMPSASSDPRSSFDSADHQKTLQNMVKTLTSSVPATTFSVGKSNNVHSAMFSDGSSKSGLNSAPDHMEDSVYGQSVAGEWGKIIYARTQQEVSIFHKFDKISEDNGRTTAGKLHNGTKDFDLGTTNEVDAEKVESSAGNNGDAVTAAPALQYSHAVKYSEMNCYGILTPCSNGGKCKDFFQEHVAKIGSHSEASESVKEVPTRPSSESVEVFARIIKSGYDKDIQKTLVDITNHEKSNEDTNLSVAEERCTEKAVIGQDKSVSTGTLVALNSSHAQVLSPEFCSRRNDTPVACKKDNVVLFQNGTRTGIPDAEMEVANVTVGDPRSSSQRTFTLEEATETILFCSSIAHDMAFKAATIGTGKEIVPMDASCPRVTHLEKSFLSQRYFQDISYKCIQNSQKFKKGGQEIDTKKPSKDSGDNDKKLELVSSGAGVRQKVDSMKHPKLESKCNCTMM